jgi:hypothetical protein
MEVKEWKKEDQKINTLMLPGRLEYDVTFRKSMHVCLMQTPEPTGKAIREVLGLHRFIRCYMNLTSSKLTKGREP